MRLMMRLTILGFALSYFTTFSAVNNDTIVRAKHSADIYHQEAGYYLNHLDSFVITTYYRNLIEAGKIQAMKDSNGLSMPDNRKELYEEGLARLDASTPFHLAYNEYVVAFIDLYLYKKRYLTENCMGLSEYYFPVFEELLDKYNLPIEFKYLAIVESALNVNARSRAGAAGLWQFMYRTGKYYGLEINSYVDERYELYAATDAACRYFRDMYAIYGNWELVIAAYNCGPGNVNKAIRRSGGKKDYWEIRTYLPRETRGYVPAFIAVNYAMAFGDKHGLDPAFPDSLDLLTDTLRMTGPFNFDDLTEYFCGNTDHIAYLNSSFKRFCLPDDGKNYTVRLPIGLMNAYLQYQEGFEAFVMSKEEFQEEESPATQSIVVKNSAPTRGVENIHVVKSGEVLGLIAEKYGCSVTQIKDWNNLYSSRIYEGQKLVIFLDRKVEQQPVTVAPQTTKVVSRDNPNYKYHVIKPGDTLWDIAKLYDGLTVTELKKLNSGLNYKKLKPGDKIIVSKNS